MGSEPAQKTDRGHGQDGVEGGPDIVILYVL